MKLACILFTANVCEVADGLRDSKTSLTEYLREWVSTVLQFPERVEIKEIRIVER